VEEGILEFQGEKRKLAQAAIKGWWEGEEGDGQSA
jgi:hypothetical protein